MSIATTPGNQRRRSARSDSVGEHSHGAVRHHHPDQYSRYRLPLPQPNPRAKRDDEGERDEQEGGDDCNDAHPLREPTREFAPPRELPPGQAGSNGQLKDRDDHGKPREHDRGNRGVHADPDGRGRLELLLELS